MKDLFVGVDVGTTHLKVGIFDIFGDRVAFAERDCTPAYLSDGRVEIDAERWWNAFGDSFEECLRGVERSAVRAIGVSSQAQTYVLLDESGTPLRPAKSWLDVRGDVKGTSRDLAGHGYYRHTGWPRPSAMLAACKLRRDAETGNPWKGARHLLFADGYLIFRLTGRPAVSRNLAAMSGIYSMEMNDWWPAAVESARVPAGLLPPLYDVGQCVAELDSKLARHWNIPVVPVVAGANDQTAAGLGAGLSEPGQVAMGLGTTLVVYQVIDAAAPFLESRPLRGPYAEGLQYQIGLCSTAGAAIEWVRNLFVPGGDWDDFFAGALSAKPGCKGLRANPNFTERWGQAGWSGTAGAFIGLRLEHNRKDISRALLEGVACAGREQLDLLNAGDVVRVTGGASINDGWMQMMADITGRRLERLDQPHASVWGTALMAGQGAGFFSNVLEAARSTRGGARMFTPRKERAAVYARVYKEYLDIVELLPGVSERARCKDE